MKSKTRNSIKRKNALRNRTGGAAMEFALTVPLLFFFVFASLEFSRTNLLKNMCQNAAMEGARAGIVPGATAADCQAAASELLDVLALDNTTVTVIPAIITNTTTEITVTVNVPMTENALPMSRFVLGKTMERSITLPRELH